MSYKATTSIPENRERKQKEIVFDDTMGTALDIWTPGNGEKIAINDVILSVMNKHATGYILVGVQVFASATWKTLVIVSVQAQSAQNFAYNFGGRVHSGEGDGTSARIRMVKSGTSTNWESYGGITGEEI